MRLTKLRLSGLVQVSFTGALRLAADGRASIDIEAHTIGELIKSLGERFPEMSDVLDEGIAVAIDGVIYRDDWTQHIPDGAQVFVMARIAGG
jgi:sulfur-carrier protein